MHFRVDYVDKRDMVRQNRRRADRASAIVPHSKDRSETSKQKMRNSAERIDIPRRRQASDFCSCFPANSDSETTGFCWHRFLRLNDFWGARTGIGYGCKDPTHKRRASLPGRDPNVARSFLVFFSSIRDKARSGETYSSTASRFMTTRAGALVIQKTKRECSNRMLLVQHAPQVSGFWVQLRKPDQLKDSMNSCED